MEDQEAASVNTGDPEAARFGRNDGYWRSKPRCTRRSVRSAWDLRRARCGESRTAGSGSGPGKRAGRKTGTAPRTDFTTPRGRIGHCGCGRRARPRRFRSRLMAGSGVDRSWAASSTSTRRQP